MKIAAVTPEIHLGDCGYNSDLIIQYSKETFDKGCGLAVFPGFSLTGCSCGDFFRMNFLHKGVVEALCKIKRASEAFADMLIAVGFPRLLRDGFVNECIALIKNGDFNTFICRNTSECDILNHSIEIDGKRYKVFSDDKAEPIVHEGMRISFMTEIIPFKNTPSDIAICMNALEYYAGSISEHLDAIAKNSSEGCLKFICVSSGAGESTDECLYSGLKAYADNGELIDYSVKTGICVFNTDTGGYGKAKAYHTFTELASGFLPEDDEQKAEACMDILRIQAIALGNRLNYLGMNNCVIGLSGGLDSTLALIAAVNAYHRFGLDPKGIICVTMPGFGTGNTTKSNAYRLVDLFGVTLVEIDIKEQVALHLNSIAQPVETDVDGNKVFVSDVTFENAQARTRTMILMDIANKENAVVIGTGDMSELALGWCTYNGDHMSMFAINAGVPKSAISDILRIFTERVCRPEIRMRALEIMEDIINTPVSPELLPLGSDGEIVQSTEALLGPYELHDRFLYRLLSSPEKNGFNDILEEAVEDFSDKYDRNVVENTFKIFIKRFFTQQFKRSCLPVGPKVLKYSLSPRSGFLMASDLYMGGLNK